MSSIIDGNIHKKVLASCVDVPRQRPAWPIALNEVGISGKTVWVPLPQGRLPFSAKLYVALSAKARGIHMSRMEEVISELYEMEFDNVSDYAVELSKRLVLRQEAENGKVFLAGKLPLKRVGLVSEHTSIDSMDVTVEAQAAMKKGRAVVENVKLGVGVNHITACPCTQEYNKVLFNAPQSRWPLPTHSQRSFTRLTVGMRDGLPHSEDLLACLEGALHVTQDLLKRHDEAEIVLKAHNCPQFAEDAVRETARQAALRFKALLPDSTMVEIESLSLESIHIHDVHCRINCTLGEICRQLAIDQHDNP